MISFIDLILRFAIVQNKFQQTNKTKINHFNDNHIRLEVSLHYCLLWPTMWRQFKQAAVCTVQCMEWGPIFCVSDISDGTQPCVYNELRGCVFQSVIALRLHTKKTVPRCYRFGCCWHSDLKLEFLLEIKTGHMFHKSFE